MEVSANGGRGSGVRLSRRPGGGCRQQPRGIGSVFAWMPAGPAGYPLGMNLVDQARRAAPGLIVAVAIGASACGEDDVERGVDKGAKQAEEAARDAEKAGKDAAGKAEDTAEKAKREVEK